MSQEAMCFQHPTGMLSQVSRGGQVSAKRMTMSADVSQPAAPVAEVPQAVKSEPATDGLKHRLKIGGYFGLWYALNIGYNIYNKKVLNVLPLPWTMGLAQLAIGLLYFVPLWATGLRKAPKLSQENLKTLSPLAMCHLGTHMGAVLSLGAGAVSFTHIVKASEPLFTAGLSAVFLQQFMPWQVYATLLPVVGGVAIASLTELSFSWLSFSTAMASNTFSALRGIFAKKSMNKPQGENMNSANLYAVLTCMSVAMLTPLALLVEGAKMKGVWEAALATGISAGSLSTQILLSGLFYYLYNEVAFLALDNVAPVTHAVGNTIKRVVVIVAAVVFFGTKMTAQGIFGSTMAVGGVLLYSLAKDYFSKK
eukprot:CAMPEP_0113936846 /NCGR_PEP_ID=MMETSP1339-20121228/3615_1 /TAXON_ID=94617 /ORGANISM="Fibrocapsa japonica" /LENGTH=364 /DNA_ID=CAMNT_0000939407 /DNA_START=144 /DNA_END=1238 /DNA_ORIENTATION=- /assembly_acc=CAM_ASM_000762